MNFRSVAQLSDQVLAHAHRIPADVEVVAGIPRSGMLVATLLSLYRNLPLADLDGLLEGRGLRWGRSTAPEVEAGTDGRELLARPRKVLVVDDSANTGRTMAAAREQLSGSRHEVLYGAAYASPEMVDALDWYCEELGRPRLFAWNAFKSVVLGRCCLDLDGVICHDPRADENDDGEGYEAFLAGAHPLHRPSRQVGWIVTSRLERYRAQTEDWLQRTGIAYGELVMLDLPDVQLRRKMGLHSAFKADVYRATGADLFVESSIRQSVEISHLAQRDVLCTDTMQLIRPDTQPLEWSGTGDVHRRGALGRRARALMPTGARNALWHAARSVGRR